MQTKYRRACGAATGSSSIYRRVYGMIHVLGIWRYADFQPRRFDNDEAYGRAAYAGV
jgi:hypothetical protein